MRVRLDLAYCGSGLHGWAKQPGYDTVQGRVETALQVIFRQPCLLTVAGRTDAGVHASGQVAHFDLPDQQWLGLDKRGIATADRIGELLVPRLNKLIRSGAFYEAGEQGTDLIQIKSAKAVSEDFDARFSALWRCYHYRIWDQVAAVDPCRRNVAFVPGPLDLPAMQAGAAYLLGEHDFLPFAKPREGASTVRTLEQLDFESRWESETGHSMILATVRADAFCHSQVRFMIGALLSVGKGKYPPEWIGQVLAAGRRDQRVQLAPGQGLTLAQVKYPSAEKWAEQARTAKVFRG